MKSVLFQLGQWILKYKKRLIYGILALFIGQICFFNVGGVGIGNEVYADKETPTQALNFQAKATEWFQSVQYFQKLIYLLIYPILILAGKLVDNSLVYGEVFYFDTVLWQLWNIMRNLANFGLGFIFIFKIFQILIKGQKGTEIKKLLTSALIAGVGIQASWFIMAALIDVSTILTYGVGGLPLSTLKNFEDKDEIKKYNPYFVPSVIYADANESEMYHLYYSNLPLLDKDKKGDAKFISQCWTFTYKDDENPDKQNKVEIIIAPGMVYYKSDDGEWYSTEQNVCHLGGDIYYFSKLYNNIKWAPSSGTGWLTIQSKYNEEVLGSIKELQTNKKHGEIQGLIDNGTLLLIGNAQDGIDVGGFNSKTEEWGLDVGNEKTGKALSGIRLNDVIGTGGYAGVFAALYGSLLNAGTNLRFSPTTDNGVYVSLLNTILSFCHMLAISIPLIVMMIVFLLRIGILRMAIVLSPIIVLLRAFDLEKNLEKNDLRKYITVKNLIPIIFSPAVICFAVSMSTVLVRIINAMNRVNIETGKQDILGGLIPLDVSGLGVDIGKLVCSVIGVAITWFLMWGAINSSKLGDTELVKGMKNLASTTLGSIPIIPIPTKDGLSFVGKDAAFGGNGQEGVFSKMSNQIQSTYSKESYEAVEDLLNTERALERQADAYKNKLVKEVPVSDWTQMSIRIQNKNGYIERKFSDVYSSKKEDIINAINAISDDAVRDKFGEFTPTVTFKDKNGQDVTYVYGVLKTEKYKDSAGIEQTKQITGYKRQ